MIMSQPDFSNGASSNKIGGGRNVSSPLQITCDLSDQE